MSECDFKKSCPDMIRLERRIDTLKNKVLSLLPECTAFPKGQEGSADCAHLGQGKCWAYPDWKCQSQSYSSSSMEAKK